MTVDKSTVEIAEETLLGDLMNMTLDLAKALPEPWQKLSEQKQGEWLDSARRQCLAAARQTVSIIAAGGHITVPCTVDSVTFKDGVKVVLKVVNSRSQGAHDIADNEGEIVAVVIADESLADSDGDAPAPDRDQPDMLDA